ncbi:hypothetical protein L1987_32213 [Smallanthus sonchifolius]|uniref:Uncharacterized protein n=1 Tax=Smallanthus sonchifolius TaxID=185202 RepID=A0ACB9I7S9_9ASTR|nr:hypothetical protein L1987_32213 [Smallanthus sonchifolius]
METTHSDSPFVIVTGGGLASIAALHDASFRSRERIDGRICTDYLFGFPVDLGASCGVRNLWTEANRSLKHHQPRSSSCADILALAARDSSLIGSKASNLPSPLDSVDTQRSKFAAKGLDDQDLVTLSGAHTIGQTDCRFFRYRLYNFTTTGNSDPSLSQ